MHQVPTITAMTAITARRTAARAEARGVARWRALGYLTGLLLCAGFGCGGEDVIGSVSMFDSGPNGPAAAPPDAAVKGHDAQAPEPSDARVQDAPDGGPHDSGTVVGMPSMPDPMCSGITAETTTCEATRSLAFTHAICSCGEMVGTGSFSTETTAMPDGRADVGINSSLSLRIGRRGLPDDLNGAVDGALVIAGTGPLPISGTTPSIRGQLKVAGSLSFAGNIHVTSDVFSRDVPIGNGSLVIDGDLYHDTSLTTPAGAVPPNVRVAGSVIAQHYTISPPCNCDPSTNLDLAQLVTPAAANNDDASAQLTADSLANVPADRTVTLPCGRYYFSSINSLAELTWKVSGHAIVFVAGDFTAHGDVSVELEPYAELDLVVGGSLSLGAAARFGDATRPGASRVYVKGNVALSTMGDLPALPRPTGALGDAIFVGNLYAPAATLQLAAHSDVYGSLFVNQLVVLQSLLVHYDPSVLDKHGASCDR